MLKNKCALAIFTIYNIFSVMAYTKQTFQEPLKCLDIQEFHKGNAALSSLTVVPSPDIGLDYDATALDCLGIRPNYQGGGVLQFDGLTLKQHMVHFSPESGKDGDYFLSMDLSFSYTVVSNAPIFLRSNDEACYWHIFNARTGRRGALYSRERISLEHTGAQTINIELYRGYGLDKGTCLLAGHHMYAIHDAATDRFLGVCPSPGGLRYGWGVRDAKTLDRKYYPDLLFTLANLHTFTLAFHDFRCCWEKDTPFTVRLQVTDADNETFDLPRANLKATIIGKGQKVEIPMEAARYRHDIPKGWFKAILPEGFAPERIILNGEVVYSGPEGRALVKTVHAEFAKGEGQTPLGEIDQPPSWQPMRDQRGRIVETRALFSHAGPLLSKEAIDKLISKMQSANMNVLLAQALFPQCTALWKSTLVPQGTEPFWVDEDFDPFAYLLDQAHQREMKVVAIIDAFFMPKDWPEKWKDREQQLSAQWRHAVSDDERKKGRVCRRDSAYRQFICQLVEELCTKYAVDGINFDLARGLCLCSQCQADYRQKTGRDLKEDAIKFLPYPPELTSWSEEAITAFIKAVSDAARRARPTVKTSNCAYTLSSPDYRKRTTMGQITHVWLEEGILNCSFPMAYADNFWRSIILNKPYLTHVRHPQQVALILDLIERFPRTSPYHKDPHLLLEEINALRREGFNGVAFYWGGWLADEIVKLLREGPFSEPAAPWWE